MLNYYNTAEKFVFGVYFNNFQQTYMVKLRVIVTLVISSASLIRRCYLGVLEDLPEGVTVELGDPRAIARAALIAKRYEEARIRNPRCADKLLRLIN